MSFGMQVVSPRFVSASLDGMVFGRKESGAIFKVGSFDGWFGSPGVRNDTTQRLWAHGNFSDNGWRDARLLILGGNARFDSDEAAMAGYHRLVSMAAQGAPLTLYVDDSLFGRLTATVQLSSAVEVDWVTPELFKFQFQLLAADPRKYGEAASDVTGVPVDGGGLGFALFTQGTLGVLDFGEPGDPGFLELTNSGTADTAPVFTVTGQCPQGFTITNRVTEARLAYASPVLAGQTVVLDAGFGSVQVNGVDAGPRLVRREFEMLDGGETGSWFLTAPNSVDALLRVEVTPAWW